MFDQLHSRLKGKLQRADWGLFLRMAISLDKHSNLTAS